MDKKKLDLDASTSARLSEIICDYMENYEFTGESKLTLQDSIIAQGIFISALPFSHLKKQDRGIEECMSFINSVLRHSKKSLELCGFDLQINGIQISSKQVK